MHFRDPKGGWIIACESMQSLRISHQLAVFCVCFLLRYVAKTDSVPRNLRELCFPPFYIFLLGTHTG